MQISMAFLQVQGSGCELHSTLLLQDRLRWWSQLWFWHLWLNPRLDVMSMCVWKPWTWGSHATTTLGPRLFLPEFTVKKVPLLCTTFK
jgi:hypothetical protein